MDLLDAQPEFNKSPWDYLDILVSDERIARGRQRSVDDLPRRRVAAHRVNSDPKHRCHRAAFSRGSEFRVPGSGFERTIARRRFEP